MFRPEVLYWKTENPEYFSCDNFHTFIACVETAEGHKTYFYGIPIKEKPGLVKVSGVGFVCSTITFLSCYLNGSLMLVCVCENEL